MTYLSNIVRSPGDPRVISSGPSSMGTADKLARALGWFSIGLGLMELIAPQRITRALGMEGQESLVRAYGAREIGSGILSLSIDKQVGLWSRVAGDGLDVATVIPALRDDNPKRDNVGLALAMLVGVMALDVIAAQAVTSRHSRSSSRPPRDYSDRSGFPRGLDAARSKAGHQQRPKPGREGPSIAAVH